MLCVGHNEGCLVGHGPHSTGVHVAKDTLLGRAGVSGTFSEHRLTASALCPQNWPLESAGLAGALRPWQPLSRDPGSLARSAA